MLITMWYHLIGSSWDMGARQRPANRSTNIPPPYKNVLKFVLRSVKIQVARGTIFGGDSLMASAAVLKTELDILKMQMIFISESSKNRKDI